MSKEMLHNVRYIKIGNWDVSSELFLDLIFTERCNSCCKFCISRTPDYAISNMDTWKKQFVKTMDTFPVRDIIILGGEATIDPLFFEKLDFIGNNIAGRDIQNVILTTNGIKLNSRAFVNDLANTCITSVNLSHMNESDSINRSVMGKLSLTKNEIKRIHRNLNRAGITMRINVNVYQGNCDSTESILRYINVMSGCADEIKFSPLMETSMFGTVDQVTDYTKKVALDQDEINKIYDDTARRAKIVLRNSAVFGKVNYKEFRIYGQNVILKYAQVEDKYDLDREIPTLKLYPNGNLSNEWDYKKNIL